MSMSENVSLLAQRLAETVRGLAIAIDGRMPKIGGNFVGPVTFDLGANGDLAGNASTATKLATARTINGVGFDGTVDITIPTGSAQIQSDWDQTDNALPDFIKGKPSGIGAEAAQRGNYDLNFASVGTIIAVNGGDAFIDARHWPRLAANSGAQQRWNVLTLGSNAYKNQIATWGLATGLGVGRTFTRQGTGIGVESVWTGWVEVGAPQAYPYIRVQDKRAAGVAGQVLTASVDNLREFQTVAGNTITGASLSSNRVILPEGTYRARLQASCSPIINGVAKLFDAVNGVDLAYSINAFSAAAAFPAAAGVPLIIEGEFTMPSGGGSVALIQKPAGGATLTASNGYAELYANLLIEKIG